MELISFDQGAFRHIPDMKELDGCRSGEREQHLAAIKTSLLVLVEWYGIAPPTLSKSLGLDQWTQHINQGHQPYLWDCRRSV